MLVCRRALCGSRQGGNGRVGYGWDMDIIWIGYGWDMDGNPHFALGYGWVMDGHPHFALSPEFGHLWSIPHQHEHARDVERAGKRAQLRTAPEWHGGRYP